MSAAIPNKSNHLISYEIQKFVDDGGDVSEVIEFMKALRLSKQSKNDVDQSGNDNKDVDGVDDIAAKKVMNPVVLTIEDEGSDFTLAMKVSKDCLTLRSDYWHTVMCSAESNVKHITIKERGKGRVEAAKRLITKMHTMLLPTKDTHPFDFHDAEMAVKWLLKEEREIYSEQFSVLMGGICKKARKLERSSTSVADSDMKTLWRGLDLVARYEGIFQFTVKSEDNEGFSRFNRITSKVVKCIDDIGALIIDKKVGLDKLTKAVKSKDHIRAFYKDDKDTLVDLLLEFMNGPSNPPKVSARRQKKSNEVILLEGAKRRKLSNRHVYSDSDSDSDSD